VSSVNTASSGQTPQLNYRTAIGLGLIHVGALAAVFPVFFSWSGVAVAVVLAWVTGGLGITLGYHRLLTHRSFHVPKAVEYALAVCGVLALQGGPTDWVATHRKHHAFSDRDGDPHNSALGMAWAHIGWLVLANKDRVKDGEFKRWAEDLQRVPFYRFLDRYMLAIQVLFALALFAIGGWSWVIWGVFVRLVLVYHVTWLVNSAAHGSGYQSYASGDRSRNCWWVALVAFGEGWHNNHHAFPSSARHGLAWFEFDLTWLTIRIMRFLRLAHNVKIPTPEMLSRLRLNEGSTMKADRSFAGPS